MTPLRRGKGRKEGERRQTEKGEEGGRGRQSETEGGLEGGAEPLARGILAESYARRCQGPWLGLAQHGVCGRQR